MIELDTLSGYIYAVACLDYLQYDLPLDWLTSVSDQVYQMALSDYHFTMEKAEEEVENA